MSRLKNPNPSPRKARSRKPRRPKSQPLPPSNDNQPQPEPEPANDNQPHHDLQHQSPQSPIPNELETADFSTTSKDTAHLEALAGEIAGEETQGDGVNGGAPLAPAAQFVDRETFARSMEGAFNFGGLFLKSFGITPEEKDRARAAFDALYDTACEVHWLHWLLDPQAATVQRVFIMLAFAGPKAKAIFAEYVASRKKKLVDPEPAPAAAEVKPAPRDPEP